MKKQTISVIIPTLNRPRNIKLSIDSILKNTIEPWEIIIVDQSKNRLTEKIVEKFNTNKIRYLKMSGKGRSRALNLAIKKAQGEILAFTDDDCIVDRNWLKNIRLIFEKNKGVSGVSGSSLPYQVKSHKDLICAGLYTVKKLKMLRKPPLQKNIIFCGGNCSYRREIFKKIGYFKTWLGVGSIGLASEDEELAFRLLTANYRIVTSPKVIIYHNRWMNSESFDYYRIPYSSGIAAAFGYHALKGNLVAKRYVQDFVRSRYSNWNKLILEAITSYNYKKFFYSLYVIVLREFYYVYRGLCIAFIFSLIKKDK